MEEIYKTIDTIVSHIKKCRKENNYLGLVITAEALLEYVPKLIEYSVNQENEYRKFEAKLSNEIDDMGKKLPNSYCETQAKATLEYKEWQRAKLTIDWMYEVVQMAKKLASSVENELKAQR